MGMKWETVLFTHLVLAERMTFLPQEPSEGHPGPGRKKVPPSPPHSSYQELELFALKLCRSWGSGTVGAGCSWLMGGGGSH